MTKRARLISGLIGALVFGGFDIAVLSIESLNSTCAGTLDMFAYPLRFLMLPFYLLTKNADALLEPYLVLSVLYFMGIGFFLIRFSLSILHKIVTMRRGESNGTSKSEL